MYKKIISSVLAASMIFTAAQLPITAKGEAVTLIVETEGAPLLQTKDAVLMGAADYMETAEAKDAEARILNAQSVHECF